MMVSHSTSPGGTVVHISPGVAALVIGAVGGLPVDENGEVTGRDLSQHGENAYTG